MNEDLPERTQTNNDSVVADNHNQIITILEKFVKIKKVLKYIGLIYLSIIILFAIVLASSRFVDTSGMFGGFAVLGHMLIGGAIAMGITAIFSIILSVRFINKNFIKSKISLSSLRILLSSASVYFIYLLLVTIGSILLAISTYDNDNLSVLSYGTIFILPFVCSLLIIPIFHILNRKNPVTTKEIYIITGLLILTEVVRQTIAGPIVWYIPLYVSLAIIAPAFIAGLMPTKPNTENTKPNFLKEIIILVVTVFAFVGINFFPTNDIFNKIDENKSQPDQNTISENIYCITPYKTKNSIYYHAYNDKACWDFDDYSGSQRDAYGNKRDDVKMNIYYVDQDSLRVTAQVSGVSKIYDFDSQTDNLYYQLKHTGPLFELDNKGNSKLIIESENPRILFYFNNHIYYQDRVDMSTSDMALKAVNVDTYDIKDLSSVSNMDNLLFTFDKYIFYSSDHDRNVISRYDIETNKVDTFSGEKYKDLAFELTYRSNHKFIKGNLLYYMQLERDDFLYIFDMATSDIQKVSITYTDGSYFGKYASILGIIENDLYYAATDYDGFAIHKLNLETKEATTVIKQSELYPSSQIQGGEREHRLKIIEQLANSNVMYDGYLYYSNYLHPNNEGRLYCMNISDEKHQRITEDPNSVLSFIIDGYIYYTTSDFNTGKNSFYRIKNSNRETIIE